LPHMKRPGASAERAAQSAGPGKLAPIQTFCMKYSDAEALDRVLRRVLELADLTLAHVGDRLVELLEQRREHRGRGLGDNELHPRKPLEHAGEQHVHERSQAVEPHLGDHDHRGRRVLAVVG